MQNKSFNFKYHFVILFSLQVFLFFLYGYNKVYNNRPYSIHQWRQTDCLSFTKNYFEEGMNFFSPKIHWQGVSEGKAISEFPLINYSVACLWKIFGEHEYLYRFTVLALFFTALCFLFLMIYYNSKSLLYSYFGTTLISTSPVLAYYSFNFLADVPALSFAIISLSLFFIFIESKKTSLFILSLLFATIAALLKASSASVLLIIGLISLINMIKYPKSFVSHPKLFKHNLLPLISLLISFLIIVTWYRYAYNYNGKNSNGVFLMETLPIWKLADKKTEIARQLFNVQFQMFLNKGVLFGLLIALSWLLMNLKKISLHLSISLIVTAISFAAFILLFYQVFNVHDYYLINNMLLPVVIIVAFGNYLKGREFVFYSKKNLALCGLIFLFNSTYCAAAIRLRNINQDSFCKYYPFITEEEKKFSDWFHYNYENTIKPLETITPYLRNIGIERTDKVVCIPDPSFNIDLYLMDQKGFTATEASISSDSTSLINYKNQGAKYIVITDTTIISKINLRKYVLGDAVGRYKNIEIYRVN